MVDIETSSPTLTRRWAGDIGDKPQLDCAEIRNRVVQIPDVPARGGQHTRHGKETP
jgi:hypothetical protein